MKNIHIVVLVLVAMSSVLVGCATPQAALDQANNGAALTVSLESELRKFRSVQATIAQARIDSVRRQRTRLATYDSDAAFEERVKRVAGNTATLQLYAELKELSDSRAQDERELQKQLTELDADFAKLLSPLPDTTPALTASQGALLKLGKQLSYKERINLTAAFVKAVKKSIDENRKKIDEAIDAAPVATAQPNAEPTK